MSATAGLGPAVVTGGSGFLGRRIVERLLAAGRPVAVVGRREPADLVARGVRFIQADLGDAAAMTAACAGASTVFHTAARVGMTGPYRDYFRDNVQGTLAVIEGCRRHGVARLVHTSTPSVVYNGRPISGADERLPLTRSCPSPYPLTKALGEAEVTAANGQGLSTVALRPHLIWGAHDTHLVPSVVASARSGALKVVGKGTNRVDMVHVDNAADAHLLAEAALAAGKAGGRAYFLSDDKPVVLWEWINRLLVALGEPPVTRRFPLWLAYGAGAVLETAWPLLRRDGMPPMTRFVAAELAKDHWFDISAAKRDLGYRPTVDLDRAFADMVTWLKGASAA
jgi:2-alkyl-3-oxoalkanoate reductase